MALYISNCADVPLRNYSLTHWTVAPFCRLWQISVVRWHVRATVRATVIRIQSLLVAGVGRCRAMMSVTMLSLSGAMTSGPLHATQTSSSTFE